MFRIAITTLSLFVAACGSGGAVVRQAALAVASGAYDAVLAVGVEKMTGIPKPALSFDEALDAAATRQRELLAAHALDGLTP